MQKAYARVSLLCKLKYVGISTDDLITIYVLFIRSIAEYCSVPFHSSLTDEQENKLESIQRTSLRVILAKNYVSYCAALEMCSLQKLVTRQENRQLSFFLKCLKNEFNSDFSREIFKVNFAKTEAYRRSAVIQCQHALNKFFRPRKQ